MVLNIDKLVIYNQQFSASNFPYNDFFAILLNS